MGLITNTNITITYDEEKEENVTNVNVTNVTVTKDDLILWKDYLIYSVMFGINEKVVEEIYIKIK